MRCQPPLACLAQTGHSCIVRLVISIEPLRMPIGYARDIVTRDRHAARVALSVLWPVRLAA
jgi:hypothetical protein